MHNTNCRLSQYSSTAGKPVLTTSACVIANVVPNARTFATCGVSKPHCVRLVDDRGGTTWLVDDRGGVLLARVGGASRGWGPRVSWVRQARSVGVGAPLGSLVEGCPVLPARFIHRDRCGGRDIERSDATDLRQESHGIHRIECCHGYAAVFVPEQ